MRDWLKALAECKDVTNLRSAICELFTEFGEIAHMDILTMTHPGTRQALCFLRRAAEDAHARTFGYQPLHHVAPNKSCATGDQELRRPRHCGRIYGKRERQRSVFHRG